MPLQFFARHAVNYQQMGLIWLLIYKLGSEASWVFDLEPPYTSQKESQTVPWVRSLQ